MTGAPLLALLHPADLERRVRAAHPRAAVTVDHVNPRGVEAAGGRRHVLEQGAPGEAVKHLGQAGLHPLSLACGEDDDVQGSHGVLA